MRHKYDKKADIMRTIYSDEKIVDSHEFMVSGVRHVMHMDANGRPVRVEVHEYSKLEERSAQTVRTDFKAEPGQAQVVGKVSYVITETTTGAILADGDQDVRLQEMSIQTVESPEQIVVGKSFRLTDLFTLGVASGLTAEPERTGFALVSDRTDLSSHCWEWFNIDGEKHATKLQESGELNFEMANPNAQWQIVRTEFLTDISIRVKKMAEADQHSVSWRVLIRKGSWVNWPSLVDGVVTI